jgi:hypothetical protein
MDTFKAGTQYGDWEGTAAADNADRNTIELFLEKKGLATPEEFLLGLSLYAHEHSDSISVHAFFFVGENDEEVKSAKSVEEVKSALDKLDDPIPVREVQIDLTVKEFLEVFKRFNVFLTWHGLGITGREYEPAE